MPSSAIFPLLSVDSVSLELEEESDSVEELFDISELSEDSLFELVFSVVVIVSLAKLSSELSPLLQEKRMVSNKISNE